MKKKPPYIHDTNIHNGESAKEVVPILIELFKPKSVVDVGCGLGDWLHEFKKNKIEDILGIDGDWVSKQNLFISRKFFLEKNLTTELNLNKKFDLAISLEVAEHIPQHAADTFIKTLTSLSDNIIFSAAIPGQGGQNHLNEQWHEYWISKFEKHGFYFHDIIRPLIWKNEKVEWWYKQNIFYFSKTPSQEVAYLNIIHPNHFNDKILYIQNIYEGKIGIRQSLYILKKSIFNIFKKYE